MTRRRHLHDQQGQTMVEFTLVAPLLFLILFAVIQFGIVYRDYVTLTDAVRAGARKAAVSRHVANPAATAELQLRNAAEDLDQGLLEVSVSPLPPWSHGGDVTIEASYPWEIDLLGFVVASGDLHSATTERVE